MLFALAAVAIAAAADSVHDAELATRARALAADTLAITRSYELQGRREEGYKLLDVTLSVLAADGKDTARDEARLRLQYTRLLRQGLMYQRTGFERALGFAEASRDLAAAAGDAALQADALHEIAAVRYSRALWTPGADYTEILSLHERTLALRRKLGDKRGESESLFGIGLVHERRNELEPALERHREALRVADEGGFKMEASYAERHVAGIGEERGQHDAALAGFQRSLALREEVGFTVGLPFAHMAVGDQYLAKKDLASAARHYAQARAIAERLDLKVAVVFSLLSQGDVEAAASRKEAALDLYRQARATAEAIPFPTGVTRSQERIDKLAKP